MTQQYRTEQELFWQQDFGDEYTQRNNEHPAKVSNLNLFATILGRTERPSSVIEFGSNVGLNLSAIAQLLPDAELSAIEINDQALGLLTQSLPQVKTYPMLILDFKPDYTRNFVLIKGVLIHINPDCFNTVYDALYHTSARYICIAEYYNPTPVEMTYRRHQARLFKRDFAGELLDRFSDLHLRDYGFVYHRDNCFPQGDLTWFLLEKQS